MGQSFTIRILPSRSRMVALISPTFSLSRIETSFLPSRISWRASRTQVGQSESVSRGQPSGGLVFWYDFSSGLSDQRGVNDGFWLILLAAEKTCQTPLAAIDSPFSTYLIGACMRLSPCAASPGQQPKARLDLAQLVRGAASDGNCPFFSGLAAVRGWAGGGRRLGGPGYGRARSAEAESPLHSEIQIEYLRTLYFTYGSPDRIRVRPCRVDTTPRTFPAFPRRRLRRRSSQPVRQGLYDPRAEHDACGVGFVVHMKGQRSHDDRPQGAAGADQPRASRRLRLRGQHRRRRRHPDSDARQRSSARWCRSRCPPAGTYGAGLVFLPRDARDRDAIKAADRADRRGGRPDASRLARGADRQRADRRQRQGHAAAVRAGVHRRRAAGLSSGQRVRAQAVRDPQARRARRRRVWGSARCRAGSSTSSACRRTRSSTRAC